MTEIDIEKYREIAFQLRRDKGAGSVHWKDCAIASDAIDTLLSELEDREADRRDNPRLWSRKDVQKKAIEYGFEYWRAPDSHGVECTTSQAVDFLQDLLGVEAEIKDVALAQRQEGEEK